MLVEEALQGLAARERDVAGEDEHAFLVYVRGFEDRRRLQNGVAGAVLLVLHGVAGAGADRVLHRFALVADDHDRRMGGEVGGEVEDVFDDGAAGGAMEDLDGGRLHARAEAGREDDHFEVVVHGRAQASFLIRSSVRP